MFTERFEYPIDLSEDDDDGSVMADFPDVKGCATDGADRAEALANAADALAEGIAAAMLAREDVPEPSQAQGRPTASLPAGLAAKAALYQTMREDGVNNSELARLIGRQENEVRRMLDPRHATKISRLEQGLAVLGKRLVVAVRAA